MTDVQARWIRVLRVELGCSFGRVAELLHYVEPVMFPGTSARSGRNQCEIAAHVLGDSIEQWEQQP